MKNLIFLFAIIAIARGQDTIGHGAGGTKAEFRNTLKVLFFSHIGADIDELCTHVLTPEQIAFGNQKLIEFVRCGNRTIDKFVDKLDADVQVTDIEDISRIRKFTGPVCEVSDDMFECFRDIESIFDECISDDEKRFKTRLWTIVPLIRDTICLRNGDLLADLIEHNDGVRCLTAMFDWVQDISFDEIFDEENAVDFFSSAEMCRQFNILRLESYRKLRNCSSGLLEIGSDMLGYFCEGTKCNRFIRDLECF